MLPRRRFLLFAAALPAVPRISTAGNHTPRPGRLSRPRRRIVRAPAGGVTDLFARLYGEWLGQRLGQPFIIENRPGAGGNIATEAAVRAPSDGHTLLFVTSSNAWNPALYANLSFNFA